MSGNSFTVGYISDYPASSWQMLNKTKPIDYQICQDLFLNDLSKRIGDRIGR